MRKKDYELIASTISRVQNNGDLDGSYNLISEFKQSLSIDPKFDPVKFEVSAVKNTVFEVCPYYNETVLPDEGGNCSLCGKHRA